MAAEEKFFETNYEKVNSVPSYNPSDYNRLIYDTDTKKAYKGTLSNWEEIKMAAEDIPEDREMCFPCMNEGCLGSIKLNPETNKWQCDTGDWIAEGK